MKIGIVTLPLRNNYGGLLQAFALQEILKRLGHEPVTFDLPYCPPINWLRYPLIIGKRFYLNLTTHNHTRLFDEFYYKKEINVISRNTRPFINKYINRQEINSFSNLDASCVDAIIVGSDQVWRPQYQKPEISFLGFVKNKSIKKVAYAASFGTDIWQFTENETDKCRNWIKDFCAVSVREESGVKLCKQYLDVNATHVLDPTMLLTAEDYISHCIINKVPERDGDLMCYALEDNSIINDLVAYLQEYRSLTPFNANSKFEDSSAPLEERVQESVESWLRGFYDAKIVITDSFHACAFSMIFNKPFAVIGNKDRGMSRFDSLLKIFNQEFRLVSSLSDYKKKEDRIITAPNIDMERWKNKSISFLTESLK